MSNETKQSARELLKEARAELAKAHDHLMELTAKLPMQYFGLVDGNIIQAEDCFIGKIDAYLDAPSESAMEMVEKIRDTIGSGSAGANFYGFTTSDSDAAALIEGLQRRNDETCEWSESEESGAWEGSCGIFWTFPNDVGPEENGVAYCPMCGKRVKIAAKHGVKVEG